MRVLLGLTIFLTACAGVTQTTTIIPALPLAVPTQPPSAYSANIAYSNAPTLPAPPVVGSLTPAPSPSPAVCVPGVATYFATLYSEPDSANPLQTDFVVAYATITYAGGAYVLNALQVVSTSDTSSTYDANVSLFTLTQGVCPASNLTISGNFASTTSYSVSDTQIFTVTP